MAYSCFFGFSNFQISSKNSFITSTRSHRFSQNFEFRFSQRAWTAWTGVDREQTARHQHTSSSIIRISIHLLDHSGLWLGCGVSQPWRSAKVKITLKSQLVSVISTSTYAWYGEATFLVR